MKKVCIAISLVAFGLTQGCKYDASQWRGTDRNGIYYETGLLDQWPENGPDLLWVYEGIGRGFAAPVVSDDKVFVNGEQVYRFLDVRIAGPDQDKVNLNLKKGWNELLIKVENNFGGQKRQFRNDSVPFGLSQFVGLIDFNFFC